ncbi:hypothetical protein SLA2020_422320 [Shorea laevis]
MNYIDKWWISIVIKFETHSVVDLVVLEGDVILVDVVPLLDPDLLRPCPCLRRYQLLQVADRVIVVALHPDLLPQPIVQHYFDHLSRISRAVNPSLKNYSMDNKNLPQKDAYIALS